MPVLQMCIRDSAKAALALSINDIQPLVIAALAFAIVVAHVAPASLAAPEIFKTPFVPSSNAVDTVDMKSIDDMIPSDKSL